MSRRASSNGQAFDFGEGRGERQQRTWTSRGGFFGVGPEGPWVAFSGAEPYVPADTYVNAVAGGHGRHMRHYRPPAPAKLAITFRLRAENAMQPQLTPQEALIYAMVTVAAVDRKITRVELDRINGMVRELPALRGIEDTWLSNEAQSCGRILAKPDGVTTVVAMIVAALPANLRETAYALAAEVAASDLAIKDDERDFLALLG